MTEEKQLYKQDRLCTIFGPIRTFKGDDEVPYKSATDQFNDLISDEGWSRIKMDTLKIQAVPLSSDMEIPMGMLISFLMEFDFEVAPTETEKDEANGS